MNTKLLLGGGLVAALLLFGKPKASKSASKTEKESEVIPDSEEVEEKPPAQENKPTYPQLNTSRLKVINELLKVRPMSSLEPFPYGSYPDWAKNKYPGFYQEWLSNIAYWKIARAEKKTDIIEGDSGEFPYFLRKSTKAETYDGGYGLNSVNFPETDEEANARLKKGIALWGDINKYIIANLKGCPPGAKCG